MSAAAPRSRKKSVHVALESTFATDPSSNGSGYFYVPAEGISYDDQAEVLETEYETGRNFPTDSEVGADGASLSFRTPLIGLATAAGNSTNASTVTDDWLDYLLNHALGGAASTTSGRTVSSSTSSTLVLASDVLGVQDLVGVYDAAILTSNPRTQWALIGADAGTGTYGTVYPNWAANPTAAGVAYGAKIYQPDDDGGASLAACVTDDSIIYNLLGGRCNKLAFSADHARRVMCDFGFMFDRKSENTSGKTSLPAAALVSPTPIKLFKSPVYFNGTAISTRAITIDLGIEASAVEDNESINGRAGNELIKIKPTVTIEPLRSDTYTNLKRNGTKGRLLCQLGGGVLSGGVLNTVAIHMERAEAREVTETDQNGIVRQKIVFHATDRIEFSAGVGARFFQIARS